MFITFGVSDVYQTATLPLAAQLLGEDAVPVILYKMVETLQGPSQGLGVIAVANSNVN